MTEAIERDEFAGEDFIDKNASLPTVIVLNDQQHCGYFIPVSTMAKCGWINFDESQLVSHTFRSGETEQGVLIRNPRMLVCPKTDLYQYDAQASEQQRTKVVVGLYNPDLKDDPNIKTERLYLVFFLDNNNEPLHTSPLKYAARGVNGATFETERRAFKSEIETCHAITNQVPAKPKNDLFHSLSVFCFTTKAELAGDKQKSWCCRVTNHSKPTTENWRNYFVGYSHLKDYAWSALEPGQKIDVLEVPALPQGEEMVALQPGSGMSEQEVAIGAERLFPPSEAEKAGVGHASRTAAVLDEGGNSPEIPF